MNDPSLREALQRCLHDLRNAEAIELLADQVPEAAPRLRARARAKRDAVVRTLKLLVEDARGAA